MALSPEALARRRELERIAPIAPKGVWLRTQLDGKDVCLLCGTIGAEFDAWQRRLSVTSAADALASQQIGLDAVEKVMDELEAEARRSMNDGETLCPRRSPGYGELPFDLNRDIVNRLDAPRRIGVFLTDSLLLVPSKSVTAICEVKGGEE